MTHFVRFDILCTHIYDQMQIFASEGASFVSFGRNYIDFILTKRREPRSGHGFIPSNQKIMLEHLFLDTALEVGDFKKKKLIALFMESGGR